MPFGPTAHRAIGCDPVRERPAGRSRSLFGRQPAGKVLYSERSEPVSNVFSFQLLARVRTQELRGEQRTAVEALPLRRRGIPAAPAVEVLRAELAADRRIARAGKVVEAVGSRRRRCADTQPGLLRAQLGTALPRIDIRREARRVGGAGQGRAADDVSRIG